MKQIREILKTALWDQNWPNLGQINGHTRAKTGKHITHITKLTSLTSKYDQHMSRYYKNSILWDQNWPNLGLWWHARTKTPNFMERIRKNLGATSGKNLLKTEGQADVKNGRTG